VDGMVSAHDLGDVGERLFERDTERDGCRNGAKKGAASAASAEQYGELQNQPRAPIRLSCAEIRRLLWQVVLIVERSVDTILDWSLWRRWHQAWARYYHYRRREQHTPSERSAGASASAASSALGTGEEHGAIDLVEEIWQRLQPLLPTGKRCGRPYSHDRRIIVEAIVYQRRTGCAWNELPSHFPPYQTVHDQLRNWQKSGIWAKVWEAME
jgi:Putative transposase of IS4/5 family (DUF4096)